MGRIRAEQTERIEVNVKWRDGLPADRTEDVANEVALYTSGLTSQYSAILRLNDGDTEATEKELERIDEEKSKNAMNELALGGGEGQLPQSGDMQQGAALIQQVRQQGGTATGDTRKPEEGGNAAAGSTSRPPTARG